MSAPAEYHLAKAAGFGDPYAYGMPLVLSSYAGIAAVVAADRPKGARGRASAIIGAGLALSLAMAAQVVGHWLTTGHMASSGTLVAIVSAVPPLVVGHLLHLAATPTEATRQDAPAEDETPETAPVPAPVTTTPAPVLPAAARLLPTLTACGTRPAAQDTAGQATLLSTTEVAILYGVDPSTVRGWVSRGALPIASKDSRGRNRFDPSHLAHLAVAAASQN
ncbi:helix-turn-helix domain-containing protein [Kitasatospora sp. NBC_00070]|uniref:MerR family transcriptional regulator n=1 Tax=Kitasatospora sp. NBC_00070 TaxID=2975962 RepID=UPI00324BF918